MGDTYRRLGLVDMLATGPRSPVDINTQIRRVNIDFDILGFRQHGNGTGRRMDTPLGLGFRDALHPVGATFVLEPRVGAFTGNHGDDFFEATHLRFGAAEQLNFPALVFCIAGIHAKQVPGKQGSLVTAGAGPDFKNDIPIVIRIFRQQHHLELLFKLLLFGFQFGDLCTGHLTNFGIAVLEQFLAAGNLFPDLAIALVAVDHINQFSVFLGQGAIA